MGHSNTNKSHWIIAFGLSILFNLIVLDFFYLNYQFKNPFLQSIELQFEQKVSLSPETNHHLSQATIQVPEPEIYDLPDPDSEFLPEIEEIITEPSNIRYDDAWTKFVELNKKYNEFKKDTVEIIPVDTSFAFLIPQFSADDLVPQKDPMGDAIYRHGSGGVGLRASQSDPIDFPEKEYSIQFDFTPAPIHAHILGTLYKQGEANQNNIYYQLPDSITITAEGLDDALEFLYIKGLLARKKISAEHKIIAVFVPIEISQKNRKNPIFLYKPTIHKEQLKTYINSLRRDSVDSTKVDEIHQLIEILNL